MREEGKGPDFVLEVASPNTWCEHVEREPGVYAGLGVKEYFLFDPTTGEHLTRRRQGYGLVDGEYERLAAATATPRVHRQWRPDELRLERGLGPDTTAALEARGHRLAVKWAMGSTQSVMRTGAGLFGASDPRRPGALTLGY